MAKPKFNLSAAPTFKRKVSIPVPGCKSVDIEFTFKHKTRDGFKEFIDGIANREDVDVILDIACGWEIDEPFEADYIEELNQNYIGSARQIIETYINELTNARLGNS